MKKLNLTTNNVITCILYLVIGILLCALRTGLLNILMTVIGILFIAYGVYDVIKNRDNIAKGIIEITIGVVILVLGWTIGTIVLLVFGILITLKGVLDLINNIKEKKGTIDMINAIVTIVVGIIPVSYTHLTLPTIGG